MFLVDTPLAPRLQGNPLSAGALPRRERFASWQEAWQNFSTKAPLTGSGPTCSPST